MIPTMLLVGLVVGRRWIILAGAAAWAAALLITGAIGAGDVPVAAALAAANLAAGVSVRWVFRRALQNRRRPSAAA